MYVSTTERSCKSRALSGLLYHLEAIDIENDEYMFWDANGHGLTILIKKGRVIGFANAENKITLQQAFDDYVRQLGVGVDTTGTPEEIWDKVKKAKEELPHRPSFLSRLFNRTPK